MKKKKDKKGLIFGVITALLAMVCFGVHFFTTFQWRFVISGMILLALSSYHFYCAFSRKGLLEELGVEEDERDRYITMKSSHLTVKITNYILFAACFISVILYAAFQFQAFLVITITLCVVLVALFVIMLLSNSYYEKHQ